MSESPRVLLYSQRRLAPLISRCLSYEFEDVICQVDAVDLVAPTYRHPGVEFIQPFEFLQLVLNRVGQKTAAVRGLNPGVRHLAVGRDYELFFMVCQFVTDLPTLNALKGWRQRARIAACWIEEIWARDIPRMRSQMRLLRQFDLIFTNCRGSVEGLAEATGRPCHYVPPAVDCLRFFPGVPAPERVIDVYAMGRRHPDTHRALLDWAGTERRFYLHDTFRGNLPVQDPAEHRDMLANLIKRTRYFVANKAKVTARGETEGQQEVGFRFFEGAAAGAVMIGDPPDVEAFRQNFDWPDAVVQLPYGSAEAGRLVAELDGQPKRVEMICQANISNALRRHDWVDRWSSVTELVGMERTAAAERRKERLLKLAGLVNSGKG